MFAQVSLYIFYTHPYRFWRFSTGFKAWRIPYWPGPPRCWAESGNVPRTWSLETFCWSTDVSRPGFQGSSLGFMDGAAEPNPQFTALFCHFFLWLSEKGWCWTDGSSFGLKPKVGDVRFWNQPQDHFGHPNCKQRPNDAGFLLSEIFSPHGCFLSLSCALRFGVAGLDRS